MHTHREWAYSEEKSSNNLCWPQLKSHGSNLRHISIWNWAYIHTFALCIWLNFVFLYLFHSAVYVRCTYIPLILVRILNKGTIFHSLTLEIWNPDVCRRIRPFPKVRVYVFASARVFETFWFFKSNERCGMSGHSIWIFSVVVVCLAHTPFHWLRLASHQTAPSTRKFE